jgi:uncharacterized protein DUF6542
VGCVSSLRTARRRTLWEEGRRPGRLVRTITVMLLLAIAVGETLSLDRLGLVFDLTFVVVCAAAALAVRPRDFFMVGVLPPLSMLGIVTMLAVVDRSTVADPGDGLFQAIVSGLAHHAGSLVVGYTLTLGLLAVRQVARENAGRIRASARTTRPRSAQRVPQQRRPAESAHRVG